MKPCRSSLKEKIIGVLNLSDKKDLAPFTDDDLQLLTSFANLASLMIEHTLVLEESAPPPPPTASLRFNSYLEATEFLRLRNP